MYSGGYRTKKDLKASKGELYRGYSTSLFEESERKYHNSKRIVYHVGPSAYERKWYAQVTLDADNRILAVK